MRGYLVIVLLCSVVSSSVGMAAEEPLWDELKRRAKSPAFNIGALVQVVGTYENDAPGSVRNGFALANFRLKLKGELDGNWGYYLQTSFIKSPAFLDASVHFTPWGPVADFRAGSFKAPFSAELLISSSSIDFVHRAQVVTALAAGRQVGFQVAGQTGIGFGYAVGAFNGNGLRITNDDDNLMTAGRFMFRSESDDPSRRFMLGVNGYHSVDTDAPIGVPITGDFIAEGYTGERLVGGADFRLEYGRWLVSSEILAGRYDPRGASRVEPWGYDITLGYGFSGKVQALGRWDSFRPDGVIEDSELVILGLNYWPTSPTEIQVNAVIPTFGSRNPGLLVNAQVAF